MKKTTLTDILKKYDLTEDDVDSVLWEEAQEDHEAHFIVIRDCSTLFILDVYDIEDGSDGFYEGSVTTIQL